MSSCKPVLAGLLFFGITCICVYSYYANYKAAQHCNDSFLEQFAQLRKAMHELNKSVNTTAIGVMGGYTALRNTEQSLNELGTETRKSFHKTFSAVSDLTEEVRRATGSDPHPAGGRPDETDGYVDAPPHPKKKAFIDLGANKGDSIQAFVGLGTAQGGKGLDNLGSDGGWEIWAFEANPVFDVRLIQAGAKIAAMEKGYTVHIMNSTAAWINDGNISFFLDTVNESHDYWGSSIFDSHWDVVKSGKKNVTVPSVHIARLLLENYDVNDEVVLKVDIEGAEYDLMVDLLRTGALRVVDSIFCEWHAGFWGPASNHANAIKFILGDRLKHWGKRRWLGTEQIQNKI